MANSGALKQTISFKPLGTIALADLLELETPPFLTKQVAFHQLKYVEEYILRPEFSSSSERCVAIESHYIDRDFMTDHSVLFSRNLSSPPNYCKRVHFFACDAKFADEQLRLLAAELHKCGDNDAGQIHQKCIDFSAKYYLGFTVIRPLPACPVGRTVLHLLPPEKEDGTRRLMSCTRDYDVHLMGATLNIRGLAFQQQDLGVSRCATVALWCALHKLRDTEGIASPTPSEITNLASRNRLPFGRPMPSEGLAVDQMCLAVQAAGASPELTRVVNVSQGRNLIYSAARSAMPAILIMELSGEGVRHAVTVTGIKTKAIHEPCLSKSGADDDSAGDLIAIYVHDDRIGPYRRAELDASHENVLSLSINRMSHANEGSPQKWLVVEVLVPMHPKIRISFNDLRIISQRWIIPEIQAVVAAKHGIDPKSAPVRFTSWFERGHLFFERVLRDRLLDEAAAVKFCSTVVLPRYVGILQFESDKIGMLTVLVDTTSPRPNYNWIGVIDRKTDDEPGKLRFMIAEYIAALCRCDHFY